MTNISLLLVALLLAALHQQLLIVAGGVFHKETASKHSSIHQHRHQHFVSDTKTNQQHNQHHRRSYLHSRQQQQQQQQQQHHQQHSATWQQQHKIKSAISTEPTTITIQTTTMHRNQHLQYHHHQQQQQQQQQEQSSSKLFAAIDAASDIGHTYAAHTFAKGQRQPLLTSTEASTLAEVSAFSVKADSAAYQQNQLKSASSAYPASTAKSSSQLADANRAQNYKSSIPNNPVVVDDKLRLKSMESLDYADDYYYDDDDDVDNNNNNNNHNNHNNDDDDDDDDVYVENYDSDVASDHQHQISSSARVVRAHHLPHLTASGITSISASRLDHQASKLSSSSSPSPLFSSEPSQYLDHEPQLLASDQDYADDEPYRSSAENYVNDAPGVLTEQKFRELGTLEAVQQIRDKILHEQDNMRQKTPAELAREHMDRMKTAGRCSRPLPRVIHVSNETSKRYVPYCTILHRCGEDTGCCDSTRQVCAAKSFEDVPVYFFVIKVNSRSNKRDTEVLMLRNHTECHCINRSNLTASLQYMPRDKRSDYSRRRYYQQSQQLRNYPDESLAELLDETSNMICRCPKHFDIFPEDVPHAERHSSDTFQALRCRCDCLSHNLPCRRLQHGEEGFAVDERKCIAEHICKAPVCLHGDYSHQTGRCPRRKNHKRTVTRYDYGYG